MSRRIHYYDFDHSERPIWESVAFPDSECAAVPDTSGIYRFVCCMYEDRQTLYTDIAPSDYGESLRDCYNYHVTVKNDKKAVFYDLYITEGLEFEHCKCNKNIAKKHKHYLITQFRPHYNIKFELVIDENSGSKPFNN